MTNIGHNSGIPQTDWAYDIETYMDLFCVCFVHLATGTRYIFEVSDRVDQSRELITFLWGLQQENARLFGYNNNKFDWPVLQHLMDLAATTGSFTAMDAHMKGNAIIGAPFNDWSHSVAPWERYVTQGDLLSIHHFDNVARSTSLKKLEINMRAKNVVDLPYPPDQPTTSEQKAEIVAYMCHDVSETVKFYHASLKMIEFRDELALKYPDLKDVLNMNDTKIGKQFFIMHLEQNGTQCFDKSTGRRRPRQTHRTHIALRDVISPRVTFRHPEFLRIKSWLESQTLTQAQIDETLKGAENPATGHNGGPKLDDDGNILPIETKGVFKGVHCTVDGFDYHFGTGGIHGSVTSTTVREDDEWEIWDWDVASYYPNLAISNGLFPEHLSSQFCDVYQNVYDMRRQYNKKTHPTENGMLKLALNGVYGDSNNKYSPFYDPQYTMGVTINGQLMLCMLAEWLTQVDGSTHNGAVEMIQINTDGLTVRVRKSHVEWMVQVCEAWEQQTGLELEGARYKAMHVRDVNSYIAEKSECDVTIGRFDIKQSGGVKRIGAYAYQTWFDDPGTRERQWHQDHSMLVIRKAAEAALVHGTPVEEFVMNHRDPFDFMLSVKVARSGELWHGDQRIQNTSRYYMTTDGAHLTKKLKPTAKQIEAAQGMPVNEVNAEIERLQRSIAENPNSYGDVPGDVRSDPRRARLSDLQSTKMREFSVRKGWTVGVVNDATQFRWDNVNWLFYINEARKLLV